MYVLTQALGTLFLHTSYLSAYFNVLLGVREEQVLWLYAAQDQASAVLGYFACTRVTLYILHRLNLHRSLNVYSFNVHSYLYFFLSPLLHPQSQSSDMCLLVI